MYRLPLYFDAMETWILIQPHSCTVRLQSRDFGLSRIWALMGIATTLLPGHYVSRETEGGRGWNHPSRLRRQPPPAGAVSEADWGIVALSCKPACPTNGTIPPPLRGTSLYTREAFTIYSNYTVLCFQYVTKMPTKTKTPCGVEPHGVKSYC